MAKRSREKIAQDIRSPRSAGIAGLIFSFLVIFQLGVSSAIGTDTLPIIPRDILEQWSRVGSQVLGTMPFAGIAFLWFTGVIRDWLGEREDRFFSTGFLGSGIIYVAMMFVYAAVLGAILGTSALAEIFVLDNDVFIFGFALLNEVLGNYALRMAGVYMLSIGSLLTRTGHAPRWLVILTFLVAVGFLLFAGIFPETRYIFPIWVAVISIYILVLNYRRDNEPAEQV